MMGTQAYEAFQLVLYGTLDVLHSAVFPRHMLEVRARKDQGGVEEPCEPGLWKNVWYPPHGVGQSST
jgi:hypothetical protein